MCVLFGVSSSTFSTINIILRVRLLLLLLLLCFWWCVFFFLLSTWNRNMAFCLMWMYHLIDIQIQNVWMPLFLLVIFCCLFFFLVVLSVVFFLTYMFTVSTRRKHRQPSVALITHLICVLLLLWLTPECVGYERVFFFLPALCFILCTWWLHKWIGLAWHWFYWYCWLLVAGFSLVRPSSSK